MYSKITRFSYILSKAAISIVYIWFGAVKFFGVSPANVLIEALLQKTMPFFTFDVFIIILAIVEVTIGILFLIPKTERVAIVMLVLHMFTTILPLFLLPEIVWQGFLIPTLEGQYIIKNIVVVALAIGILVDLESFKSPKRLKSHRQM